MKKTIDYPQVIFYLRAHGFSYTKIGRMIGLSKQRVNAIHLSTLKKGRMINYKKP